MSQPQKQKRTLEVTQSRFFQETKILNSIPKEARLLFLDKLTGIKKTILKDLSSWEQWRIKGKMISQI